MYNSFILLQTLYGYTHTENISSDDIACAYLGGHYDLGCMSSKYHDRILVLDGPAPALPAHGQPDTILGVDELCNKLMRWQSGDMTGRFWLYRDDVQPNILIINLVQVKTGRRTMSYTTGCLVSQRAAAYQEIDEMTIAGVVVRAERDFVTVIQGLSRAFSGHTFKLGTFSFYTTGQANSAITAFEQTYIDQSYRFSLSEALKKQLWEGGRMVPERSLSFTLSYRDGVDWLCACVPSAEFYLR